MIRQLTIKNIAVIDTADIEFDGGFSVLTGETGAGKSIIIDSLNMIKGERASKNIIRNGETKAKVSALVSVSDEARREIYDATGIDAIDGELLISREITLDGKNNIRVNGTPLTLSMLKVIGDSIITIHGQHDNTSLLSKKTHIVFLDRFSQDEIAPLLGGYKELHAAYKATQERLNELLESEQDKEQKADMLRFRQGEILSADLRIGEEEELVERKNILDNFRTIADCVNKAYNIMYDSGDYGTSAYDALWNGINELADAAQIDTHLGQIHASLSDAGYSIQESLRSLGRYIDSMNFDHSELDEIENRLDVIFTLKRKYGNSIEQILDYCDTITAELDDIDNCDEMIKKVRSELKDLEMRREQAAKALTTARTKAGEALVGLIEKELSELDMSKVRIKAKITPCDYRDDGADDVEFLILTNVGEDFKPLAKIASGGELSRVMLAIKSVLSHCETADTLIFDEVDAGVSGHAAQKIAVKLHNMSRISQVLCITHLPQIAAMAGEHYLIQKTVQSERTHTTVTRLSHEERVDELARTLGGAAITDITRQNAKELLSQAREYKEE